MFRIVTFVKLFDFRQSYNKCRIITVIVPWQPVDLFAANMDRSVIIQESTHFFFWRKIDVTIPVLENIQIRQKQVIPISNIGIRGAMPLAKAIYMYTFHQNNLSITNRRWRSLSISHDVILATSASRFLPQNVTIFRCPLFRDVFLVDQTETATLYICNIHAFTVLSIRTTHTKVPQKNICISNVDRRADRRTVT